MDSEQDEEEDVYEVERIIDMRVEDGENLYLVRWKNFSSDDDTWEPKAHLEDCREVLLAYERSLAEKKLKKDPSMKLTMKSELFDANSESDSDKDKLKESPSKKKKKHTEESEDKKSEKDKKKKKEKWKEDQPLPAPESDEEEERVPTLPPTKKDKPTDSQKRAIKKEEDENDDAPAKKRKKEIKVKDGGKQKKEIVEERKKEKAKSEKEIESSGDETDKSDAPSELYADDTSSTGNLHVTAKPTTAKTTEKSSRSESGSDHSKANQKKNKSELKLQGFKDLVQDMNPKKTDSSALLLRESGLNKSKSLTSSKSSSKSSRSEDEPDFSDAGATAKAKSKPKGLDSNSAPQKDLSGSSSSTVLAAPSKPREEERPKEQKEETVEKGAAPNNLFEKFLLNCEAKDRVPRKQAAHTPKSSVKPDKKAREESPVQKTEFDQVKEGTIAMEADERREKSAQESEKSDRSNEPVAEMKEDVQPELRDAVKNGNHMAVKRALGSKEDYNLDQQATLIHRRSPAVSISKQQLSALTRRLVDLEAKVGLLEARLNERSHPSTADKSMATDSPVDVLPTPVEPRTECQQVTHIHPSGYGEFSLTNEHLDIDSFGFPSAVSTPCIDRNHSEDIAEDSDYLNHQLTMLDYNYSPVQESASTMSNTSEQCPSAMSSFCLRLPETPRNASNFQSHNSVRRSLMGVILQDVTLNHVSMEVEKQLYADAAGSDGTPRADRFAAGLFKRLIPLTVCHEWVGSVNYDGSKGKNALPLNVRQAISDAVARKFHPSLSDWKLVRDRINELLRKKRLSIPLF